MRLIKALGAVIVLAAVLVGPPWALVRFIGNPWPDEGVSLSAPLTDNAIIGLLAVVVWVLWIQLVACIVVEAIAALTDDRVQLRVPLTLAVQQHFARRLVTALVLVAVATPVAASTAMATTGDPTPAPEPTTTPATSLTLAATHQQAQSQTHDGVDEQKTPTGERGQAAKGHTTVTVMRLDSLWSIADRSLGDGDRWSEIAALNEGRTMSDGTKFVSADHIKPGWELRVPAGAVVESGGPVDDHQVVVEKGDTLSQIALEELGDAHAYPEIVEASAHITQPGGLHLVDPDVIDVGWTVQIPGQATPADRQPGERPGGQHRGNQSDTPGTENQPRYKEPQPPEAPDTPLAPQAESTDGSSGGTKQTPAASASEQQEDERGFSELRALLGAAACLSVGSLGLMAANRRRQFRRRRIGRTIASTPEALAEVEQAIVESGSEAQGDVEFLDRALRHVAASYKVAGSPLPQLGAAVLGEEDLTLLFIQPAAGEVPEGWTTSDDARAWMLPRDSYLEDHLVAQPAPYPALVSIGQDESGHTWLLDLETLGMCGLGGEPQQVADLARFMVAELAVNAWSKGCEVLLADQFGAEMIGLNPARLRQVDSKDALARASSVTSELDEVEQNLQTDVLTRRRDGLVLDTTNPVVVVVDSRPDGEFVADLEGRERCRVVVVHGDEESPAVELRGEGTAYLPMWGISVKAFLMTPEQAGPMAEVLAATRNLTDEPMPTPESDDGPLGKYARVDGSLREEYTEPRHTEGGDTSSMLPEADEVYLAAAATTAEDLAAVARSVPEATRAEVAALDPTLDEDLADWLDDSSPRPKLQLLGPIEVRARDGGDRTAIDNAGMTISFIAYLACQERGVTVERAMSAFGWKSKGTVENRAADARVLLGPRPSGTNWLPEAGTSDAARRGAAASYELVGGPGGVLNTADLFVRLRNRAERRGDAGGCEEDLVTALSLVTGAPSRGSRTGGSGGCSRASDTTRSCAAPSPTLPICWPPGQWPGGAPTWFGWRARWPGRRTRTAMPLGWMRPRPPWRRQVRTAPTRCSAGRSWSGTTRICRRAPRPSSISGTG